MLRIWARGLAVGAGVLVALTLVEWIGIDFGALQKLLDMSRYRPPYWAPARSLLDLAGYSPFSRGYDSSDISPVWTALWFAICVALRLWVAWIFLRRAARNFDRVAPD